MRQTAWDTSKSAPLYFSYNNDRKPPWTTVAVTNRGLASFALTSYNENEEIFREKHICYVPFHWPFKKKHEVDTVEATVNKLSEINKKVFFDSANAYDVAAPGCRSRKKHDAPTLACGIFYTNSFDMVGEKQASCGIFPAIARLNHSCRPNTRQEYFSESGELVLYASRRISEGDQLFDSYTDLDSTVKVRKKELERWFRFVCDCDRCEEEEEDIDKIEDKFGRCKLAA